MEPFTSVLISKGVLAHCSKSSRQHVSFTCSLTALLTVYRRQAKNDLLACSFSTHYWSTLHFYHDLLWQYFFYLYIKKTLTFTSYQLEPLDDDGDYV